MADPIINIQNVVATAALGQPLDLDSIVQIFPGVEYRPEQFPGLIYRMNDPKVVILLFTSGNLVVTGAKKEEEVYRAVTILKKTLEEKELIRYAQQ